MLDDEMPDEEYGDRSLRDDISNALDFEEASDMDDEFEAEEAQSFDPQALLVQVASIDERLATIEAMIAEVDREEQFEEFEEGVI